MSKIILYSCGNRINKYLNIIDFSEVVGCNETEETRNLADKVNIISLNKLKEIEFDYIVVFAMAGMIDVKKRLINKGVDESKILNCAYYYYVYKNKRNNISSGFYPLFNDWSRKIKKQSVLDVNAGITYNNYFSNTSYGVFDVIDNYEYDTFDYDKRMYRQTFNEIGYKHYNTIICLDFFVKHNYMEWKKLFTDTYNLSRYMIVSVPYTGYSNVDKTWDVFEEEVQEVISVEDKENVRFFILDKNKNIDNIKIYIATQKECSVLPDDSYIPIYAGASDSNETNMIGDDKGDNISHLNPWINECTVLYYVWKNTKSHFVGLNHYRRFLTLGNEYTIENIVKKEDIVDLLYRYDMLVGAEYITYPLSLKSHMKKSVDNLAFEEGYNIVRDIVLDKYPEYIADFDVVFEGNEMYRCNLMVCNRDILNMYCSWLFDIIIEACYKFDIDKYDSYSKRTIGFIAERLLTVWIVHNNIDVKRLNVVLIE